MSTQEDVLEASRRFYSALNAMLNGDAAALAKVWHHGDAVTTMHPVGGRQVGWAGVWDSWTQVAGIATGGGVRLGEQRVEVAGDTAYEVGVEQGECRLAGERVDIDCRVTNIYRRYADGWKIVHHHADVSPAMQALLARLEAKRAS